jgi:DNA-binding CsgD family transcriptional regulator
MRWFKSPSPSNADDPGPPEGMNTEQEKQWRISLLTDDERKAFEWFRLGYTARWTAETMLLDRKTARRLFGAIYRKLRVADEAEVSRVYRTTKLMLDELHPGEDYPAPPKI